MEQPDGTFIAWAGSVVSQLTDSRRSDPLNEFASVTNGGAVTLASYPRQHSTVRLSCPVPISEAGGPSARVFAIHPLEVVPESGDDR